jgi:hypothetical protein
MSFDTTIRMLRMRRGAAEDVLDPATWRRVKARCAWATEVSEAWLAAAQAMDERCREAVGRMDEAEFERFVDAEQAKLDAIRAPLQAAIDKDVWPEGLYWSL